MPWQHFKSWVNFSIIAGQKHFCATAEYDEGIVLNGRGIFEVKIDNYSAASCS